MALRGRGYLLFSRILLEKVGGTYLSLIFLRSNYIPTVQKNRTQNDFDLVRGLGREARYLSVSTE